MLYLYLEKGINIINREELISSYNKNGVRQ